jgi:hypothetical protein
VSGRYEHRDIRPRFVLWAVLTLLAGLVFIHLVVWGVFDFQRDIYRSRDVRRAQVNVPEAVPPAPRIEVNPTASWEQQRSEKRNELRTYGWVERDAGRARIPIERAIDLIVERHRVATSIKERER